MKRISLALLALTMLSACGSHRTVPLSGSEPAPAVAAAAPVASASSTPPLATPSDVVKALPGLPNGPSLPPTPAPTLPPIVAPTSAPVIPGSINATWPPGVPLPPQSVAAPADLLKTYSLAPVLPAPTLGPTDTMPVLSTGAGMYFTAPPSLGVTPWTMAANAGSPALGWLAVYVKRPGDTAFLLHDSVAVAGQRVHAVPIRSLQPTTPGTYWFFAIGGDAGGGIQDPKLASIQGAEYKPGQ